MLQKKASEFYLEYLNFINLLRNQLNMLESGKVENDKVAENINTEIQIFSEKLKTFPHFEHHHINIFYNLTESRALEITKENFEILGKMHGLSSMEITEAEFNTELKNCIVKFNENYSELAHIYEGFIEKVRNDITDYL